MTVQLRPFQSDLAVRISQAWRDGARDVLGVLPCGAGKSILAAHFLQHEPSTAIFIAHRAELVSGESLALARTGVRHRVIGQPALRRECSRRHVAEGLYDHVDHRARVAIASVDTLVGLAASDPLMAECRLVVTDECFPAGTLVDGVSIETLRVGDLVTAFDEITGEFAKRRITALHRNPAPKHMMRVAVAEHHVLHCTLGHPFWTKRGWKLAYELDTDDEVYCDEMRVVQHGNSEIELSTAAGFERAGAHVLCGQEVRDAIPVSAREEAGKTGLSDSRLHRVRESGGVGEKVSTRYVRRKWSRLLWQTMFGSCTGKSIIGNDGANESQIRFRKDACKQPNEGRGNPEKSQRDFACDKSCSEDSGWERKRADRGRAGFSVAVFGARIRSAVRRENWRKIWQRCLSAMLQTRFGAPRIEDCPRSGRAQSCTTVEARTGREERRVFAWHRLDSVTVYERRDSNQSNECSGDGFVYNIEVEELHTYVANGVVVHNCHHLCRENKWGRALDMFPNARGLGLSATPIRADGKGLGRHADGVFDVLLEGPTAREIELMGFLAPHVIYAPPSDLDLSTVPVSASGDYSPKPLAEATRKSHIMGDVVDHYKRLADGLLGMTFCVDVESSVAIAAAFRAAGVPAEVVTGKTPADARNAIFRRFRNREILQLVSCEIAGEGFDLPDVEVISLARASESYALATQQIGRVKRALPGKKNGIVIDHVGNTTRHCQAKQCAQTGEWYIAVGEREWSLDRRERRTSSKVRELTLTTCIMCLKPYPRVLGRKCPYCSHETQPAGRSAPEQVDGVLSELDPATLAAMQQAIAHVDGAPTIPWGATPAIQGAMVKRHRERQEAQVRLREAMAAWAGSRSQSQDAETVARLQREWFLTFGIDVASAQAFGRAKADELRVTIMGGVEQ